jgi:hypothetical protein
MLLADVAIEPMTGLSMRVVRFNRVWLFRLDPSSGKGYDIVSLFWSPYGRHHIVIFLLLALDAFVGEHVVPLWPPVPVDVPPLPRLDQVLRDETRRKRHRRPCVLIAACRTGRRKWSRGERARIVARHRIVI